MGDTMLRVLAKEAGVRGLACVTADLTREAGRRHHASPLATAALGYGVTAAALLGGLLKVQERVALKAQGDGPVQKIVLEADSYGRVRGYVAAPDVPSPSEIGRDEISAALGNQGVLTVVKDLRLRDLYQGAIQLQSGELDRELERYLNLSEQVPSLVRIGIAMDGDTLAAAGGLLIQLMPGQDPAILRRLAQRLEELPALELLLASGATPAELMARVFPDIAYEVLEERPLSFSCTCSRERSRRALKILGGDEIVSLLAEGEAVVDCHFCHERYVFDTTALAEILEELEREEREALASIFADLEELP